MASKMQQEKRAEFKRYKEDVAKEGKPFFPYAIFHDTIMSLVVVVVIIALAVIWHETAVSAEDGVGVLGPLVADKADPGTTNFIPRPDWFFYFLFYLLRIFKWPETVVLGTVGIPTVCLILLIGLPFFDRRPERAVLRRPVAFVAAILVVISMGVLTWKGATAKEGSEAVGEVPAWAAEQGFADDPVAVEGATLFAESGCLTCHVYLNAGGQNLGAPELTEEGLKNRGIEWQVAHLQNPSSKTPGSVMPPFATLGEENLTKIATFLEASKGKQG